MTLPFWADTPHGRAIIAAILKNPPRHRTVRRYSWVSARFPRFLGDDANCLRRLWQVQCDAALRLDDGALYHRLQDEIPDDLIERVLLTPAMEKAA